MAHNNNICQQDAENRTTNHASSTRTSSRTRRRRKRRYNKWPRMIRKLEEYYAQHGHSRVSRDDDPELQRWTIKLRNNYRHQVMSDDNSHLRSTRGRPRLSDDQLNKLKQCQFSWNAKEDAWRLKYEELCQFRARNGHCRVPIRNDEHKRLGVWVNNQRREYRHLRQGKHTTLTMERVQMLDRISFLDDFQSNQDVWDLRMEELRDYYNAHNHSNVPEQDDENYSLGQWVMNLRTQYKRYLAGMPTILTPARIAALEVLDFRWNLHSYTWFTMLERLKQHSALMDGNLDNITDENLHYWVIRQRHLYQRRLQNRTSSLTDKRMEALEAIAGFSWKASSSSQGDGGPSVDDWAKLFEGIREKGITPDMPPKQHWFEGEKRDFQQEIKEVYSEEDLLELWYQEE